MSAWQVATRGKLENRPSELLALQPSELDSEYRVATTTDLTSTIDRLFLRRRVHVDYVVESRADTPGCSVAYPRRIEITAGLFQGKRVELPLDFVDQIRILESVRQGP